MIADPIAVEPRVTMKPNSNSPSAMPGELSAKIRSRKRKGLSASRPPTSKVAAATPTARLMASSRSSGTRRTLNRCGIRCWPDVSSGIVARPRCWASLPEMGAGWLPSILDPFLDAAEPRRHQPRRGRSVAGALLRGRRLGRQPEGDDHLMFDPLPDVGGRGADLVRGQGNSDHEGSPFDLPW